MLQDPGYNCLLKNFQDSIFSQKIDKRRITEAYSYIGARMSESDWLYDPCPSLSMLRLAAKLASERHLPSVKMMILQNIDLGDIPRDHICKLTSIVRGLIYILNITPASLLDIILVNVRCQELWLVNKRLTEPQTRALVTAMTKRLEDVKLDVVTLDIQTLCQYNGRGTCRELHVRYDTRRRYGERLERWGTEVGWAVTREDQSWLIMKRK